MKLFALVIHIYEDQVSVHLYRNYPAALKAGAEQVLRLILEDSTVDLGDNPARMHKAMKEKDYDLVIRFFESQKKRRCVFIREAVVG
jgi:hypothetical protein